MKKQAIILGAGPTGLVTGWLLSKKGWDVKIFEKNKIVGGMCRSWKWKNNILDTGPHIFHTPDKNMWNFWNKNFGHLLIKGEFWAKNTYADDFNYLYDYPLSYESISKFDINKKKKIKEELIKLKRNKNRKTKNFHEHVVSQVGETLTDMFFKDYPEKLWGINTSKMTAEWAPKRIKFREKILPFFSGEYTAVGKYGTGSIYEFLKKKILSKNGKIYLNQEVIGFEKKNFEIKNIFFKKRKLKIEKDTTIISTLPITLTARLLGYKSNLKFRGVRTVYVLVNKKNILPRQTNWIYYSSKKIIFNRVTEHKKMTKYVAPKNQTCLSVEIAYSKNDNIDKIDFKNIKKRVEIDLIKVGLLQKNDILGFTENKEDFVYPVQFSNYKYELSEVNAKISKYKKIYSLGTGGEFNYADSQILFHKSMDLVETLSKKDSVLNQVKKNDYNHKLNDKVRLGKTLVGDNCTVYIIAEGGLNHNGDINIAKKLIDEAKKIGCNAIKFQTYEAKNRVSKKVKSANYFEEADGLQENTYEMLSRLSLNYGDTKKIFEYAKKKKNRNIFYTF